MARALPPVQSPLSLGALRRGWTSARSGRVAARAEAELRAALAARGFAGEILLADSGTSALNLALRAAVTARSGSVAIPAYGCFDLATAVDAAGVPFVLYDVDPGTLAPVPGAIECAVAEGATIVLLVHLYGVPVDVEAQRAELPAGVILIDDAAQGVGATCRGKPLGSAGDFGILSFGRGKGLTGGSGGALLVNRPFSGAVVSSTLPPSAAGALRPLVTTKAQWLLARPGLYALPRALPFLGLGETPYRPAHSPTGIAPFALGVLADGVAGVDGELAARRRSAQRYRDALAGVGCVTLFPELEGAGWLRFPVVVAEAVLPMARSEESARLGIMPGYPSSLADLAGFGARRQNTDAEFPGAKLLASRIFTLPTHGALAPRDVDAVIERVRRWR